VDTQVLRIARRLGLTRQTTPEKVERDLMRIVPQSQWIDFTHRIISHGRQVCIARKPRCADCPLEPLCNASDKTFSSH
jgi:endonuclease-3